VNEKAVTLLNSYLDGINDIESRDGLEKLDGLKTELLSENDNETELALKNKIFNTVRELMYLRERASELKGMKLSGTERQELEKVKGLIDNNLFTYFFQPIVRADTGEIYSFEALMRARDHKEVTPFQILKYAELTGRLAEIEQYTFLNILGFVDENRGLLDGRPIFINSMPSVKISPEKTAEIDAVLGRLSDLVVVEMTEQSEFNDEDLDEVKERFHRLNIRIAVDDYGAGYSNISNLLRYTPNIVKIDRMLLSGIQDNPNKKHFVREIIDFCHDNGIMALAEGVETYEELHTVILLGTDLIQGYYIARPSPELIASVPYDIRSEIRTCSAEREMGRLMKAYAADAGERVSLEKLGDEGFDSIIVGSGYSEGTVTVAGSAFVDYNIHIETADDFKGRIVLDYAHIANDVQEPCIDIGENNDVTISTVGENQLKNSGIRVPESSRAVFEGSGEMRIELGNGDYYGIGNDLNSTHGELVFDLDAAVRITSSSHSGVCIGSGLGGIINIKRGVYILEAHGSSGVCVGSFGGGTKINIFNCDLEAKVAGARNTVIGSLDSEAEIGVRGSSLRCSGYSQTVSGIGSVGGYSAVNIENASIRIELHGAEVTGCGSLKAPSSVRIRGCTYRASCDGTEALLFGGFDGGTKLSISEADVKMSVSANPGKCVIAAAENIDCGSAMYEITVGDEVYDRIIS